MKNVKFVELSETEMKKVDGGWIHIVLGIIIAIEVLDGFVDGWNGE